MHTLSSGEVSSSSTPFTHPIHIPGLVSAKREWARTPQDTLIGSNQHYYFGYETEKREQLWEGFVERLFSSSNHDVGGLKVILQVLLPGIARFNIFRRTFFYLSMFSFFIHIYYLRYNYNMNNIYFIIVSLITTFMKIIGHDLRKQNI